MRTILIPLCNWPRLRSPQSPNLFNILQLISIFSPKVTLKTVHQAKGHLRKLSAVRKGLLSMPFALFQCISIVMNRQDYLFYPFQNALVPRQTLQNNASLVKSGHPPLLHDQNLIHCLQDTWPVSNDNRRDPLLLGLYQRTHQGPLPLRI